VTHCGFLVIFRRILPNSAEPVLAEHAFECRGYCADTALPKAQEFDGIGPKTVEFHAFASSRRKGLLKRTLVSQDAGCTTWVGPAGGEFRAGIRTCTAIFCSAAKPAEVLMLMREKPRAAFGA
jgi:hypothetical protein